MRDFYTRLYIKLLDSYLIKINTDYQFIYDDFLEHLIIDSNSLVEKNFNKYRKDDDASYHSQVFKGCFYQHFSSSEWGNKLIHPEKYPELKRKIRIDKLNKILKSNE